MPAVVVSAVGSDVLAIVVPSALNVSNADPVDGVVDMYDVIVGISIDLSGSIAFVINFFSCCCWCCCSNFLRFDFNRMSSDDFGRDFVAFGMFLLRSYL